LKDHPDYVAKRYEMGRVAFNDDCHAIYRQARQRLGKDAPGLMASSYAGGQQIASPASAAFPSRMSSSSGNPTDIVAGVKGNPLHVVVDEGELILRIYRLLT